MDFDRRGLLVSGAAAALAPTIARASAIDADRRTGTIADVEHVVILMQENRSFDHYFGAMNGVRGFADRFPIPVADDSETGATVWKQRAAGSTVLAPFPLNTTANFAHMRVEGTPHNWSDAQAAWDHGRMSRWPVAKTARSMGYYRREDIPFQYALADAFTVCDAYHASFQGGTNTNRLFLWSGTNDPEGARGGPSISNSHDNLATLGGHPDGYRWTTYVERLQAAGVSWRVYQDMADNFTDNPLAGFKTFRDSHAGLPGSDPKLAALGLSTRALDGLRADVLSGALPCVSYIVAPARDSEHPEPSSPAQGADYTARVLDALTADAKVWARTALLVMYDENDGFFDHVPPPAPPSRDGEGFAGASTVDTKGEYHLARATSEARAERDELTGRPYGLGPRVPMIVISSWSRGGWVNSEVFDHTSVIRFLERRFGVLEPNISPWRRAICGDLTSAFDFKTPNHASPNGPLPATQQIAAKAAALRSRVTPPTPANLVAPSQALGERPSRALPYDLNVEEAIRENSIGLTFVNNGSAGAVFHVYDRPRLEAIPRRYTVGAASILSDAWPSGAYDLWVIGPGGFHRRYVGDASMSGLKVAFRADPKRDSIIFTLTNQSAAPIRATVKSDAYARSHRPWMADIAAGGGVERRWDLKTTRGWYDFSVHAETTALFARRIAGRVETGAPSISDPALGGLSTMA